MRRLCVSLTRTPQTLYTNTAETFTISGTLLDTSTGADAVKFVDSTGNCQDIPGGGSTEITDLSPTGGNADGPGLAQAQASVTFASNGMFKMCYSVKGVANYVAAVVNLRLKGL